MESPLAALLWRSLRVYQIFGANTEVGKTVFTTLLCKTAKRNWKNENVSFLKPVSTGPLTEADDQCELFNSVCKWLSCTNQFGRRTKTFLINDQALI